MMKPCHAITKCDSPLPRPFSRAFHPINLVAAEVTRLKLHLAARFDDLPAFVPTGINLIRLNPAKKPFPGVATACRHNVPRLRPATWRPSTQHSAPQPATQSSPPSTSNMQRATSNLKPQPPARPLAGRASASSFTLSVLCASVAQSESNPVQVSQTKSNLCEADVRLKPKKWGGDSLSPQTAFGVQIHLSPSPDESPMSRHPRKQPSLTNPLVNRISYIVNPERVSSVLRGRRSALWLKTRPVKPSPSQSNQVKPCIGGGDSLSPLPAPPPSPSRYNRAPPTSTTARATPLAGQASASSFYPQCAQCLCGQKPAVQPSQTQSNYAKTTRVQPNYHAFGDRRSTPHGQMLAIGDCIP